MIISLSNYIYVRFFRSLLIFRSW